jgi:hypothetical protein
VKKGGRGGMYTDTSDLEDGRRGGKPKQNGRKHRSNGDDDGIEEDDDADSYIIGPESNHSMIRNREFGQKN